MTESLAIFKRDTVTRSFEYEERSFSYVEPVVTRSFAKEIKTLSFVKSLTQRSFEEDEVT